jgi:hypothetical protein
VALDVFSEQVSHGNYRKWKGTRGVIDVRNILCAVIFLLAVSSPFAAASQDDSGFSIRFYDRKVYFLGDEVQIEAVIENTTPQTMRFKIADNRFFNLDFDVRTTTNLALSHARQFITERSSDQPVFFREVSLEPGEKYSIVVDLGRFASLAEPGQFVLQAVFYPELYRGPQSAVVRSNRLSLNVKPPAVTAEEKAKVEAETGALIARAPLPPDEVVAATIQARQKSQWERFYLYLDLESLLRKNPEKDRIFRKSSDDAQRKMIESFKEELRRSTIDQEISLIPSSFEIQKTTYSASEGTVLVREKFRYPDYTEVKLYTYHLKRDGRFWIIEDYEIRNTGTE